MSAIGVSMFELDAREDVVAADLVELLAGRAAVVVNQNVGVGAGGDQLRAGRRIVEVAKDFANLDAR